MMRAIPAPVGVMLSMMLFAAAPCPAQVLLVEDPLAGESIDPDVAIRVSMEAFEPPSRFLIHRIRYYRGTHHLDRETYSELVREESALSSRRVVLLEVKRDGAIRSLCRTNQPDMEMEFLASYEYVVSPGESPEWVDDLAVRLDSVIGQEKFTTELNQLIHGPWVMLSWYPEDGPARGLIAERESFGGELFQLKIDHHSIVNFDPAAYFDASHLLHLAEEELRPGEAEWSQVMLDIMSAVPDANPDDPCTAP